MHESISLEKKKENPLDKILRDIKSEFVDSQLVKFSMEEVGENTGQLHVKFTKQKEKNFTDPSLLKEVKKKINIILKSNEFESTRLLSSGNWSFLLRIDSKFVEGKINWRRWTPRPNLFSEEVKGLLDEISTFTDLGDLIDEIDTDEYGKFCRYADLAFSKGLINSTERGRIRTETANVF